MENVKARNRRPSRRNNTGLCRSSLVAITGMSNVKVVSFGFAHSSSSAEPEKAAVVFGKGKAKSPEAIVSKLTKPKRR